MATEAQGIYDTTAPVRIIYTETLFTPKAYKNAQGKEQGDPKYGCQILLAADHADLKPIKDKAIAVAKAHWPGANLGEIKFPFKSGDKDNEKRVAAGKKPRDFVKGLVFITGRSKYAPRLAGFENGRIVDYGDEAAIAKAKSKFYSGTEALVQLNFVPGEVDEKRYVTAYLNLVLTLNKGERIAGGGKSASEVFKGYAGHATLEDPTGGDLDDEIPF